VEANPRVLSAHGADPHDVAHSGAQAKTNVRDIRRTGSEVPVTPVVDPAGVAASYPPSCLVEAEVSDLEVSSSLKEIHRCPVVVKRATGEAFRLIVEPKERC
jgi:hypothetical protein